MLKKIFKMKIQDLINKIINKCIHDLIISNGYKETNILNPIRINLHPIFAEQLSTI